MKEMVKMVVVLSLICAVCALALSGFRAATAEQIERTMLEKVQKPRVEQLLAGSDNDLIADRRTVEVGGQQVLLFVGSKSGVPWGVAYETTGGGFGGDITVMAGYDLGKDQLTGIQITRNSETPGVGTRIAEPQYTGKFGGISVQANFKSKTDGGDVDAITGATYSSRGVAEALQKSAALYPEIKKALAK